MDRMTRRGIVTPTMGVLSAVFAANSRPLLAGIAAGWAAYRWMTP
jgi:predicted membrane-bound dolichyl-phosphate-mannose-protein mannosyltransferase